MSFLQLSYSVMLILSTLVKLEAEADAVEDDTLFDQNGDALVSYVSAQYGPRHLITDVPTLQW